MKIQKFAAAAIGAAALALLSGSAKAADQVVFAAAGSSAQFSAFTKAFIAQGYTTHYSAGTSTAFEVLDASAPGEPAQVAIYYSGSSGNYTIAVFYQVDSTVGVRAFCNSDTLSAPTTVATTPAAGNKGAPSGGDVSASDAGLQEVLSHVNGTTVNVGATDITPEDARVATARSIALGYNATTNPIKSASTVYNSSNVATGTSTAIANPVAFSLTARPYKITPIGAVPVMVFVNSGPDFSTLSGNNLNIDSFTLAGFLSGQFSSTADLDLAAAAPQDPVHTYVREALSGTYNTMEYCNPESLAKLSFTNGKASGSSAASGGQEFGLPSRPTTAATGNPLNEPANGSFGNSSALSNSGRIRAVGTGELIAAVNDDNTVDSLGYAFWNSGAFSYSGNKSNNLRYLTVDGAEPLQDNYSGGSFNGLTVTFRNIYNGGYPLWSILRVITDSGSTNSFIQPILDAVTTATGGTDFANPKALRVFRSYHKTAFTAGAVSNGNNIANGGNAANGGDVGGAVFSINDDVDAYNELGGDLTGLRQ